MRWIVRVLAAAAVLAAGMGNAQAPGQRVALVIGNAAYAVPAWRLANPVRDADLMAQRLRALNFEVDLVRDATLPQMTAAFERFSIRLRRAGPSAVSVAYYSGHGAEEGAVNYLIPVDADIRTKEQLRFRAPSAQLLLDDMGQVGNSVNILILDACRDLPLADGGKSLGRGGLAELRETPNVFIAYATAPNQTAADGTGSNSPFTAALAEALRTQASDPVSLLFEDVTERVRAASRGVQRPRFSNGLGVPRWSFASAPVVAPAPNAELERLRRENETLRNLGAGTPPSPAVSAPAAAVQRPNAGEGARAPGANAAPSGVSHTPVVSTALSRRGFIPAAADCGGSLEGASASPFQKLMCNAEVPGVLTTVGGVGFLSDPVIERALAAFANNQPDRNGVFHLKRVQAIYERGAAVPSDDFRRDPFGTGAAPDMMRAAVAHFGTQRWQLGALPITLVVEQDAATARDKDGRLTGLVNVLLVRCGIAADLQQRALVEGVSLLAMQQRYSVGRAASGAVNDCAPVARIAFAQDIQVGLVTDNTSAIHVAVASPFSRSGRWAIATASGYLNRVPDGGPRGAATFPTLQSIYAMEQNSVAMSGVNQTIRDCQSRVFVDEDALLGELQRCATTFDAYPVGKQLGGLWRIGTGDVRRGVAATGYTGGVAAVLSCLRNSNARSDCARIFVLFEGGDRQIRQWRLAHPDP